jgi:HK97 gp10 family phage protein
VTVTVRGLKELEARLRDIGSVAGTKAMRSAMFTATKPILDRAKANAPSRSGALRLALSRTFAIKSTGGGLLFGDAPGSRFLIFIGPKVKNRTAVALYNLVYKPRRPRRGIFHGHFLEFGTKSGTRRTDFLKRALESSANEAVRRLADALKKRIDAAARKR